MNPLQEYAKLFVDNFEFLDEHGEQKRIDGYYNNRLMFCVPGEGVSYHYVQDCTLIARPIADMTDEELIELEAIKGHPMLIDSDDEYTQEQIESLRYRSIEWHILGIEGATLIYYLSIGVYPFDQSHFEDGTVIDARTIQ